MTLDETVAAGMEAVLPYESWERIPGESGQAFAAFCVFRDFGLDRNIRRAMTAAGISERRYDVWRNWSTRFQWSRRAGAYDGYLDRLKRAEREKSIAAREEAYRAATEKMLAVVTKRLDLMDPAELAQGNVVEWLKGSVDLEREVLGVRGAEGERSGQPKQLEIKFTRDFDGL
ncbi:MAG: hypothetical protein JZU65_22420 [Chlorobium sp.]|nr:hypothetical protein [Chlorobium sp.]